MRREVTGAVGILVLLGILYFFPPLGFTIIVGVCVFLASWEAFRILQGWKPLELSFLLPFLATIVFILVLEEIPLLYILLGAFVLATLPLLFSRMEIVTKGIWGLLFFVFPLYFGVLGSYIPRIRGFSLEAVLVWLASVWIMDSAAYYGGKLFGKRKVAPRISPNKTVEGTAALLMTSVLFFFLYAHFRLPDYSPWLSLLWGFTMGFFAYTGDLYQSLWKRIGGVKDSGFLFPGHGGFWDRMDSLLWTAPVFYYFYS